MGLDLNQRAVKLMGGGTRMEPIVYWSGFGSQGCGACFEASYSYVKGAVAAIKKEFPMDTMLQGIAQDLQDLQRKYSYKLTATAKHRGHYYHERSMDVSVDHPDWASYSEHTDVGGAMADIFADFAWWIYRRLETAWEWVNSDEVVDENIEANDYEFEEDGSCA
jgi:hypothetical protein